MVAFVYGMQGCYRNITFSLRLANGSVDIGNQIGPRLKGSIPVRASAGLKLHSAVSLACMVNFWKLLVGNGVARNF